MKYNATVSIREIKPDEASNLLQSLFPEQRNQRKGHIKRLVSDMLSNRFKLGPDAILIIKGQIANGQHRLAAVVESGKPQSFVVLESDDSELYKVLDSGLRRTVADSLLFVPFAARIPSIARFVLVYESGTVAPSASGATSSLAMMNKGVYESSCSQIEYCLENKDVLCRAAGFVSKLYTATKLLPFSMGGAIYCIAESHGHLEHGKNFLQQLYIDGGNTAAGDLRNRLIANQGSRTKLSQGYVFGLTVKAFKHFLDGKRAGVLRWSAGEEFPSL